MLQVTKPGAAGVDKRSQRERDSRPNVLPNFITGNEEVPVPCRNCVGCGFVYSMKDFQNRDHCAFCGRPLSSNNRKENRRRKEEGEDEESLASAGVLRRRLIAYDRESANGSRVTEEDLS